MLGVRTEVLAAIGLAWENSELSKEVQTKYREMIPRHFSYSTGDETESVQELCDQLLDKSRRKPANGAKAFPASDFDVNDLSRRAKKSIDGDKFDEEGYDILRRAVPRCSQRCWQRQSA
jgi:hypothetical protein